MRQKSVLIIDDDAEVLHALSTALSDAGFLVVTASDGARGIEEALREKPDLILLDVRMPDMDGHETLKRLRTDRWGRTAHVVFLTNMDDADNISQGFDLSADDYVIKTQESLASIVQKVKQRIAGYHD